MFEEEEKVNELYIIVNVALVMAQALVALCAT